MRISLSVTLALVAAFALPGSALSGSGKTPKVPMATASLKGINEVPSIITNASGSFSATIAADHVDFTLTFSGLTGDTLFAHIHAGQRHTLGGVMVFLCNNTTTGPAPQPCPHGAGTVTGTFSAADVIGPAGQGVDPAEFAALLQAIASGASYANVHTSVFQTGEIRGQLHQFNKRMHGNGGKHDDGDDENEDDD
jgi:hypothetical protein